jgi:hypothetical protein
MAVRRVLVKEGQSIFDVVIQEYGDIANAFDFFTQNPTLTINSGLSSGQYVKVDTQDKGVNSVKSRIKETEHHVVNSQQIDAETVQGDFNNDFNNDFLN